MTLKGNEVHTESGSGLQVGDFFFLSAVNACREDGSSISEDPRERILFCMRKLQDVLTEAGGSLDSLVQLRFYCSDDTAISDEQLRDVLLELIEEPLPSLSLIPSGAVAGGLMADGTAVIMNTAAGCGNCQGCGKIC